MRAVTLSLGVLASALPGQAARVMDPVEVREVGPAPSRAELDRFLSQLRSSETPVRAEAVLRLSQLETPPEQAREIVPLVAAMLRTWPPPPRPYPAGALTPQNLALRFLQQIGPLAKPALPEILGALRFNDPVIRWWAMSALDALRLGPEEASPALQGVIGWLESELTPEAVRARAQEAEEEKRLGPERYAGKEAEKAFVTWLPPAAWPDGIGVGFSTDLIFDAFRFLQRLGPGAKPALPVLLRLQQAQPERFEYWTSQTFATMGSEASEAIPALLQQLEHGEPTDGSARSMNEALLAIMAINIDDPRVRRPILAAFERYVASLSGQARPQLNTVINRAVARIGPADAETVRTFIRAVVAAPDAALSSFGGYSGTGQSMMFSMMVDNFIGQLTPRLGETVPDFLTLARSSRPVIQNIGLQGLQRLGGVPDEFLPLLVSWLRSQEPGNPFSAGMVQYYAVGILGSMGQRAAPAVPALIEQLKTADLGRKLQIAAALGRIGPPAARPAAPEFETLAAELRAATNYSTSGFFDQFLTIDPASRTARSGLEGIIAARTSTQEALQAREILLRHGIDAATQRTALIGVMDGPDPRLAINAATILAWETGVLPPARPRAIERLFALASVPTAAATGERGLAASALNVLLPGDSQSEARLIALIRTRRPEGPESIEGYVTESELNQYRQAEGELTTLIRILVRFEAKSPEAMDLLAELRRDRRPAVRTAAEGRPAFGL
jgi:hypothetical protein